MSDAKKSTKHSDFVKLSLEERRAQAEYVRKLKKDMVPVVLFTRNVALPELPNCKYSHTYAGL